MTMNSKRQFAVWAMALLIAAGGQSLAQETLTLQGPNPQLTFDDNAGTLQMWNLFGDNTGFDIIDPTAGTAPFHIEPGALDNSLVLGAGGLVGFGALTPSTELHVSTSALFPTLRLQTTGGSPRAWDLQGSGGGFSLIDVTNAGAIPFMVQSGAPTNSFLVNSTGKVGFGKSNPTAQFHGVAPAVVGNESVARFEVSDDPVGSLEFNNATATTGLFIPRIQGRSNSSNAALIAEGGITSDIGANPVIVYNAKLIAGGAVATRPLVVCRNNNVAKVTIAANGNVTATAFINASSRSLKDNIVDLDSRKAQNALRQLTPVEFTYKDDPTADPRVGFIAEDVPDIIAEADRKSVPIMDVVALVTRVVKDQQQTIEEQRKVGVEQKRINDELRKSNEEQRKLNDELLKRLEKLEERLTK